MTAGQDKRVINGLFLHRKCWEANPKLQKKENQIELVNELTLPIEEEEEAVAVIQEEQEEDETLAPAIVAGGSRKVRKYF